MLPPPHTHTWSLSLPEPGPHLFSASLEVSKSKLSSCLHYPLGPGLQVFVGTPGLLHGSWALMIVEHSQEQQLVHPSRPQPYRSILSYLLWLSASCMCVVRKNVSREAVCTDLKWLDEFWQLCASIWSPLSSFCCLLWVNLQLPRETTGLSSLCSNSVSICLSLSLPLCLYLSPSLFNFMYV